MQIEVLDFLISSEGKKDWLEMGSERTYHEELSTIGDTSLKQLLIKNSSQIISGYVHTIPCTSCNKFYIVVTGREHP